MYHPKLITTIKCHMCKWLFLCEIFSTDRIVRIFMVLSKGTVLLYIVLPMHFSRFLGKVYCEVCYGGTKKWNAMLFHVDPGY